MAGWSASSAGVPITTIAAVGTAIFPCLGRFVKVQLTAYTSGEMQFNCYLRNQPLPYLANIPSVNVLQLNGGTQVSAGVAGTQAVGGNIAQGVAPTANPVLVAGVDAGTLTRRILTDTAGRIALSSVDPSSVVRNIGVLSPAAGAQNTAILPTADQSLYEGMSLIEIMAMILVELKIANHQRYEMPYLLNNGITNVQDTPDALRADSTLFTPQ